MLLEYLQEPPVEVGATGRGGLLVARAGADENDRSPVTREMGIGHVVALHDDLTVSLEHGERRLERRPVQIRGGPDLRREQRAVTGTGESREYRIAWVGRHRPVRPSSESGDAPGRRQR